MSKFNKAIGNIDETLYKLFYKMKMSMPKNLGILLKRNYISGIKTIYNGKQLNIDSYDGSGQLTHPSYCLHNHSVFLAATPFPYSISTYENPCIYRANDQSEFKMISGPIEKPINSGDDYLNDPCLISDNNLKLYYRHTFTKDGKEYKNYLMFSESDDGIKWSSPQIQISSGQDTLISPAVIKVTDSYYLFYVKYESGNYSIAYRVSEDGRTWLEEKKCSIVDLPAEYGIWHFGVSYINSKIVSIFTARTKKGSYKLFLASLQLDKMTWVCENPIDITGVDSSKIRIYYKSTFIDEKRIIVAVRDYKNRWALIHQDI